MIYNMARILADQGEEVSALVPQLVAVIDALGTESVLSLPQAIVLSAVTKHLMPDVILDLGTGTGTSAASFAIANQDRGSIFTFNTSDAWNECVAGAIPGDWRAVQQIVGDITTTDFAPFLTNANRVLVFVDAHGYGVAARLLSHIMPLIADLPHIVICHDITDNRFYLDKSYSGKRMWRGMGDFYQNIDTTAYVNIGWMHAIVDQAVPLADFCYRNDIKLHSVDFALRVCAIETQDAISRLLFAGAPLPRFSMAYFTMNETASRHFPSG